MINKVKDLYKRYYKSLLIFIVVSLLSFDHLLKSNFVNFYNDDALFYPIISKNFFKAGMFTFDGINPTNGFHWGNMMVTNVVTLILEILGKTSKNFSEYFIYYALFDAILVMFLTIIILKLISPFIENKSHFLAYKLLIILIFSLITFKALGMETLYFAVLVVYLLSKFANNDINIKLYLAIFVLGLIRFDFSITIITPLLIYFIYKRNFKYAFLMICSLLLSLLIIILLNYLTAGTFYSTSSFLKSYGSYGLNGWTINQLSIGTISYLIIYLLLVFHSIVKFNNDKISRFKLYLSSASLFIFLYVNSLRIVKGGNIGAWYDVPHLLLGALTLIIIFNQYNSFFALKRLSINIILLFALLVLIPIKTSLSRFSIISEHNIIDEIRIFSRQAKPYLIKNSPIAVDDYPGFFTYYFDMPVIPLDGLANSPDYINDYLLTARVSDFLKLVNCKNLIIYSNTICNFKGSIYYSQVGFRFNKKIPLSKIFFEEGQIMNLDLNKSGIFTLVTLK